MSKQVACLDKPTYDLNRLCMTGEHWLAFENSRRPKERLCACGRIRGSRPVGFMPPKERPVYQVPANINGEPCNYGVKFAPEAVKRFARKDLIKKLGLV